MVREVCTLMIQRTWTGEMKGGAKAHEQKKAMARVVFK